MNDEIPYIALMSGLSESAAQGRLRSEGYNELPRGSRRTPFRIVLEVMREPMLALLLGGGAVYLALGDLQEALILLAFAMVSILITVVQESAHRARIGGAARSHQPASPRYPRRRAQTHRGPRGGARRSYRACGRRPRSG